MSEKPADDPKDFRLASDPVLEHAKTELPNAYLPAIDPATQPEFEQLGELPSGYNEIFLIARDPHWLFTYWDLDYSSLPPARRLGLQVFHDDHLETTVALNEEARNWYVPVQKAGASYRVTLGYHSPDGEWHGLLMAGPTKTPPESVSDNWDSQFATVPFHLSFNLLMDVVDAANASGEPLTEALAELQRATLRVPGSAPDGRINQLQVLEGLLGKGVLDRLFSLSSGPLSSAEVAKFLRKELETRLDSGASSPFAARGGAAELLGGASSELSSGALAAAGSSQLSGASVSSFSEELSSGGLSSLGGELSSGGLSSLGAELSSGGLSSFGEELSSGALAGSGALSSWLQAVLGRLGETSGFLSSFSGGGSGLELASSEAVTSWQHAILGGGASEAFSSEFAGGGVGGFSSGFSSESAAVWSGLELGGISSWGQLSSESSLSSAFGSGGFGSSWGEGWGGPERGFFMHVNAEVIFYGGTDPRATVYVNGEPIALAPDGTFRYHFKFSDREFDVPIVAISPDGLESRAATLSFRRSTERRGEVGATAQPAELDEPFS